MTSSKNGDETEVRMRHRCISVNLSSINEKLTKTQRAHIECTPFKWAMDISNNFSISGGLLWELVSRWDVRSRGFRVRDRIVPFTPVDVSFALGLSIVGAEVTINNIRKQLRCHKKKLVNFVRLYILLAFAEFYFPKTGNKIWAFNHLSLGKAPAVSRFSFPRVLNWPVISMQKKNIEKEFEKNMIIDRVVATEEELKYDIVNATRIAVLEYEVMMMKEARVNTPFEEEVVQDDQQLVKFIIEDEVGTLARYVEHNTLSYPKFFHTLHNIRLAHYGGFGCLKDLWS
ncbi:hypothetical protein KIW84_054733 [Lathyrus oleraceus]|uniref:Uncharacterized protein n=1 Tax=Pisum sativum TaxID=3888 RepID=A0A9D5AKG8_PEA|nr:hypothetical protein KIW84_054733 [Pisum sativum]